LIAVEDEDDAALKEETEPRYHARDVARLRADREAAILLLASPHPSFETMVGEDAIKSVSVAAPAAAPVTVVDLRQTPYGTLLSEPLQLAIKAALAEQDRIVLYMNRKGFAPALQCRDCGASPSCPRCEIPLAFYKHRGRLGCHYCGTSAALPDVCPGCGAARLEPSGIGTERVEEAVRRLYPDARTERLDRERAVRPRQAEAIRRRFNEGGIDILIGTQMLVQGPPLHTVGVVGLIHADAGLHLADFRAGERTYHALLDAVSLARPDGRVVLQTFAATHPVITALAQARPSLFYEPELAFRQALGYPPFGHLIAVRITGADAGRVQQAARRCADRLTRQAPSDMTVLGPVPAPIAHLRGRHRWQILVKSAAAEPMRAAVRRALEELEAGPRSGIKYDVDVDPIEMV
jgi:primosomal protein N' (replication factor Y)